MEASFYSPAGPCNPHVKMYEYIQFTSIVTDKLNEIIFFSSGIILYCIILQFSVSVAFF
jgi:hypothetical protein